MVRIVRAGIAVAATVGLVAAGPIAGAHPRGAVARGTCSEQSHWNLRLVQREHVIGVRFLVVTGVDGDIWRVGVAHNRRVIFRGRRVTGDPDGSFVVRLRTRNLEGLDVFRAGAWNRETGEFCRARLGI
jgi:hypothetical protein